MKKFLVLFGLMALFANFACAGDDAVDTTDKKEKVTKEEKMEQKVVELESGLKYIDLEIGEGTEAKTGMSVDVHYTGWLDVEGKKGTKFDSSVDRGQPFSFPLGGGRVIKGWDEGVAGMKIGGKRQLIIPPHLGYGSRGAGNVIPANATLIFDIELLGTK